METTSINAVTITMTDKEAALLYSALEVVKAACELSDEHELIIDDLYESLHQNVADASSEEADEDIDGAKDKAEWTVRTAKKNFHSAIIKVHIIDEHAVMCFILSNLGHCGLTDEHLLPGKFIDTCVAAGYNPSTSALVCLREATEDMDSKLPIYEAWSKNKSKRIQFCYSPTTKICAYRHI